MLNLALLRCPQHKARRKECEMIHKWSIEVEVRSQ